jgi:hypothetical protein
MESVYYPWFVIGHLVASRFNIGVAGDQVPQEYMSYNLIYERSIPEHKSHLD